MENIIGNDIRLRREEMKISLRKFAKICDISTTFLSQIERGIQLPTITTLLKVYHNLPDTPVKDKADELCTVNSIIKKQPTLLFVLRTLSNLKYSNRVAAYYIASLRAFDLINQQQSQTEQVHVENQARIITIYWDYLNKLNSEVLPDIPPSLEERLPLEIRRIGEANNISPTQYASMIGITIDHFFQIYEQNRVPSSKVLNRIINVLNKIDPQANLQIDQFISKRRNAEYGIRKVLIKHPAVNKIISEAGRYSDNDALAIILTAQAIHNLTQKDIDEYGHFSIIHELIKTYSWMFYRKSYLDKTF